MSSSPPSGLLDTSVFIAGESGKVRGDLPEGAAISVITIAELRLGVLMADDVDARARRQRTLTLVESAYDPLPVTEVVAGIFAEIVSEARRLARRPKIMDAWVAATAVAYGLPVYTQDRDFEKIPRVQVFLV